MMVLPFTSTGLATVAEKLSPEWLSLELSVSPRRTIKVVPAGITMISSAAGFSPEDLAFDAVPPALLSLLFALFSVVVAGVDDLAQPTIRASASSAAIY